MIKLREAKEEDKNLILNSFLKSYFSTMTGYKPESEVFYPCHQKALERLVKNGSCIFVVAASEEDEDIIYGWACFGLDKTLHYVFVKELYQKMGIGTRLIRHMMKDKKDLTVSHWNKNCAILKRKFKLKYNPYKFYN
jgi:GNAT superfamily N-acetyltransferase